MKASWLELLRELQRRGLTTASNLAVGDGALGFWKAVAKVWPMTKEQRCWVHKTPNILPELPKNTQSVAKAQIHQIWLAEERKLA